jgi:hypothetical protein
MSHTHPEHGITPSVGHGTAAPLHFSEAEWQQYRDSDRAACKAVVLLMTAIFTIGLVLYATIDFLIM